MMTDKPTLAEFADLVLGRPIAPYQRQLAAAIDRMTPEMRRHIALGPQPFHSGGYVDGPPPDIIGRRARQVITDDVTPITVTTVRISSIDFVPDLAHMNPADVLRVQQYSQRARALMEDDMRSMIRGEPSRAQMKPARARRVK